MFPRTRHIEMVFRQNRRFYLLIAVASIVCNGFIAWQYFRMADRVEQRILVMPAGKVMEVFAGDRKANVPVEARDHIRTFHQYFFTLDPDEKVITTNIGRALYLADGSAKRLYDNLKENGYYSGIISGNISQEITVDSITLDMHDYPFYFRCWATEKIVRPTSIVTRNLITEGYLRNVNRSDNNPHGFLIERWNTIENKDLDVQSR